MYRLSLVLCFLFLFIYGGVFGGPIFSKPKPKTPPRVGRPLPPISGSHRTPTDVNLWCVVKKKGVSNGTLHDMVGTVCSDRRTYGVDCAAINPNGPCHFDGNIRKQASYVLHLYMVRTHNCMTQYGELAKKDPSTGQCRFPVVHLND